MSLTVGQLTEIPHLGTRFAAGESGADRLVKWAHACELDDPAQWLGEGDLVMTTGLGIPRGAREQSAYLKRLAKARLSGLLIAESQVSKGEPMRSPPLTQAFHRMADSLKLPILMTAYEVPFVAVGHAVAESNRRSEQTRLVRISRLYERLRLANSQNLRSSDVLSELEDEGGYDLYVLDSKTATPVLEGTSPPPDDVLAAFQSASQAPSESLGLRLDCDSRAVFALPLPTSRGTTLLAAAKDARAADLLFLQHISAAVALEVERVRADEERMRRVGAKLFSQMLEGRLDTDSAFQLLTEQGFQSQSWVVVACGPISGSADDLDLHHYLASLQIPNLLLDRDDVLFVFLPDDLKAFSAVADQLDSKIYVGLSGPFSRLAHVPDASREAKWALEAGRASDQRILSYDEGPIYSAFFPRTIIEAERLSDEVLGPLKRYDDSHQTDFLTSLRVFLECNRSWQKAAERLFIHKQTLVYRMQRVEELTGRQLSMMDDVVEFWLALKAERLSTSLPTPLDRVQEGPKTLTRA